MTFKLYLTQGEAMLFRKLAVVGLIAILVTPLSTKAQDAEDDICAAKYTGKLKKLVADGGERKKFEKAERMAFLKEGLEIDETCVQCKYLLGMEYFRRSKADGASFSQAKSHFQDVVQACPEFHADPYYCLGYIAYGEQDWVNALAYFKKFMDFPGAEEARIGKDYDDKYDAVQEVLKETEFYAQIYANPVPYDPRIVRGPATPSDEYLPMLSPDNDYLYFTRKSRKLVRGDLFEREVEQFVMAEREGTGNTFTIGSVLPPPFNLGDNYGGVSLSINNKEMYITICNPRTDGYNNCDIFVSKYSRVIDKETSAEEIRWSDPVNLGPEINTGDGWEAQPSISSDGKTLYFATARAENQSTGIDIYCSTKDSRGKWTQAVPVKGVNTKGADKSPYIHCDSQTLYFASDGHTGLGDYDIFYAKKTTDTAFSTPKNIGYPINSDKAEHGLVVSTDGKLAYFSTNRISGAQGFDIFAFELPEEARPSKVVFLKGDLKDEQGEAVHGAKVELKSLGTNKSVEVNVDTLDGHYASVVNITEEDDKGFVMTVKKEGYAFNSHVIHTKEEMELVSENEGISDVVRVKMEIQKMEVGKTYTLQDIYYDSRSSSITQDTKYVLDEFIEYLQENSKIKIIIHGHTDDVGDDQSNLELSTARAHTVMQYLQDNGIEGERLNHRGFGESAPVASNSTEDGRALNRRTEFVILSNE